MANVVPGALWHPVDVGNRAKRKKGRGLIGHVAVSNSTLLLPGPLSTRSADWTFYLPKQPYPTGERFAQLIDLDLQCWSSADGNATCPAFESQGGMGTAAQVNAEPWTDNQVESAAIILAHLHTTESVPLQDMVNSLAGSRGLGVHRYGIDPWRVPGGEVWSSVRGKLCPGDAKLRQIPLIIARAEQLVNGDDDMPTLQEIHDAVWFGTSGATLIPNPRLGRGEWAYTLLGSLEGRLASGEVALPGVAQLQGQVAGLTEALRQIAASPGQAVDMAAVQAAAQAGAEAGVAKAIESIDVNVNVDPKPTT